MIPVKNMEDLRERLNRASQIAPRRNNMVKLCNDIYLMNRERSSTFLGANSNAWRKNVPDEYWESSNKGMNVVDVMVAVLAGNPPKYQCVSPGNVGDTAPSRGELFLDGAWRLNSRRQQVDLHHEAVFKTVKDGSCAIRVYWFPNPPESMGVETLQDPIKPENPPIVVQMHDHNTFPICIEIIDIEKIYTMGRGQYGRPFSQLFYVQKRTAGDVLDEWDGAEGVDKRSLKSLERGTQPKDRYTQEEEYIEWWGQDAKSQVWYAISFRDQFIIPPKLAMGPNGQMYPNIPFVITKYKKSPDPTLGESLPFLYPLFYAIDRKEYTNSRSSRLIDVYGQMSPYHVGPTPLANINGAFGEFIELNNEGEKLAFPNWPGQTPDVYREQERIEKDIEEGSFSGAMFGQISTRTSGYALSQVIGSDTLRSDTPKGNLELAFSAVADLIFGLLRVFSPNTSIAVTAMVRNREVAAMLNGEETKRLIVGTFVKPKQTSDEVRLATLGAQLASLPNAPVSMRYILEHYFSINQPEEEMMRKLDEDAMKDPIVRMMAMIDVLQESGSKFAPIMMAQLQQAIGGALKPAETIPGVGGGLPQGVMGNEPVIPGTGNPSEEAGFTPSANLYGGPQES